MTGSLALRAYLAFSARAERWGRRKLARRLAEGREDPLRIGERRGEPSVARGPGPLVWFHAASVGEVLSLLEVVERLSADRPDLQILITTGTVSSATILGARLPDRAIHQFVPIDVLPFVRRFLDHWRPDLAIFTESELWPALISETARRGTTLIMLNARLSETSVARWRRLGAALGTVLGHFSEIQAQDDDTAAVLRAHGYPASCISVTGTLKEGTPPPPCDEAERGVVTRALGGRPVWLAASTHEGEDEVVAAAHYTAMRSAHRLLLILAPRHPDRGGRITERLRAEGWKVARRGAGEALSNDCQIYVADTLGEMGLWYRVAPVSFVGGSLVTVGGHNPFEPAALGSAILHGPHVRNFRDIYGRLDAAGAAIEVQTADALADAVSDLLSPDRTAPMAYAAWELCSSGAEVTDKALAAIRAHLPSGEPADPR